MLTALRHWLESQTLSTVALDAAALHFATKPKAGYFELLDAITRTLGTSRAVGRNAGALERAAAGALAKLGVRPDGR